MPLPTADELRSNGMKTLGEGRAALAASDPEAETLLRRALELLVYAFLEGRRVNADLFAVTHRLGAEIEGHFSCRYAYDEASATFSNQCPIFALHARFGFSPAWTVLAHCSICGQSEFECEHVGGERYDGVECVYVVDRILEIGSLDIVTNPQFTETFNHGRTVSRAAFVRSTGRPPAPDDVLLCHHCHSCTGANGPTEDDLDPRRWPSIGK
jgi:hypothetical protein